MTKTILPNLYEKIVVLNPSGIGKGYEIKKVERAQKYLDENFTHLNRHSYISNQQDKEIQDLLLKSLSIEESSQDLFIDILNNSTEGTCLRCYISHFILLACQERFKRFSLGGQRFQLHELLPIVLNDDGKSLRSVGVKERFIPYSFQILQEYIKRKPRTSLDKWVSMKTKQSDAIERFLLELGICTDSDWAILNATKLTQLEKVFREFHLFSPNAIQHLSEPEIQRGRAILQSFHEIYRGDRQKNRQYGRCEPPTENQLQRMIEYLWATYQIKITPPRLINEIKAIANRLRDYRLCEFQPPQIKIPDSDNGRNFYEEIPDTNSFHKFKSEDEEDLQLLLSEELIPYLDKAIDKGFHDVINCLSSRCSNLADYIKPIFYFMVCRGMTQKETVKRVKSITQSQISRQIKPLFPKHPQQVKSRIQEQLLHLILNKVRRWRIVENPEQLDYFNNLSSQIEVFVDQEIFSSIEKEKQDGKNSHVNSLYFERLCVYLSKYEEV
ncbi:MAG: hypothetical protein AAF757_18255 [Cyanobacteria bacterium P01_D01_bin.116]